MKTVGVLGGMGPAATVDFLGALLAATPARREQDHLRLLVDCNPRVPDRNAAAAGAGERPGAVLAEMARGLQRQGAELLVMPCNAAHAYRADIQGAVDVPFLSMIEATVMEIAARLPPGAPVGIIAADGCLAEDLYQSALTRAGFTPLLPEPDAQARFMAALYRIKAGDLGKEVRAEVRGIGEQLLGRGARGVVAGCTEVPLVLKDADLAAPLFSSTAALVRATLKAAL